MALLILVEDRDTARLKSSLHDLLPDVMIEEYPDINDVGEIEGIVAWGHEPGIFSKFPNLKWISSLGAGVEKFISDSSIESQVILTRFIDRSLAKMMSRYAIMSVGMIEFDVNQHLINKKEKKWDQNRSYTDTLSVGVMGLGSLGMETVLHLKSLGYRTKGYSRSKKNIPEVETYSELELDPFIQDLDVLICMLPLTYKTKGILNKSLFDKMKRGSSIINTGRGGHLVENDLIDAINSGQLKGAILDVFQEEPLPDNHPFWDNKNIVVTPHIASITDQEIAAEQIAQNYLKLKANEPMSYIVNREKGY